MDEDFKPIEDITPDDILAEYSEAGEDYEVQNDVEGEGE